MFEVVVTSRGACATKASISALFGLLDACARLPSSLRLHDKLQLEKVSNNWPRGGLCLNSMDAVAQVLKSAIKTASISPLPFALSPTSVHLDNRSFSVVLPQNQSI